MDDRPHDAEGPVAIREAVAGDIPRLQEMVGALAAHHGDTVTIRAEDLLRDAFGQPPWVYLLVAEVGGDLAGYAALCPLVRLQNGTRGINLHHLFVDPGHRGQGIGRALIEASKARARGFGCTYMEVGTHPANKEARATYLACGFRERPSGAPRFTLSLDEG